jgi:NitT/TauT family transport system substrate-binding protein
MDSLFLSNKVSAIASYEFEEPPAYAAQGVPVRTLCFSQAGQQYEASGIAVNKSFLASHRQAVADLVAGLVASFNAAKANPLAAAKVMTAKFGSEVASTKVNEQMTLDLIKLMHTPNNNGHPYGWMAPKDMQQTVSYDEANYGLSPGYRAASYYTDAFFRKS